MKKAISLFCVLGICMALLCGCTQTGAVAPQKPEKNPEAWLLQQARDLIETMTTQNAGYMMRMADEDREFFEARKECLFD
jgi:outer membrane biogenesis lipoprotein LolB